MADSIWTRARPAAPARETLSRAQIVRAAIGILDAEGVSGLSMRKLAAKLDAGATSLYWHVSTKDDLLELVVDEIFGEIDVPEPDLAGWRAGATLFAHSLRSLVLRHLWLPEIIYARPNLGPNAMTLGSRGLVLFGAAGFSGLEIDFAMSSVMVYALGAAAIEAGWRGAVQRSGKSPDEWVSDVLDQVKPVMAKYPEMADSLQRRQFDQAELQSQSFAFGLDALLDGLEARAAARSAAGDSSVTGS